MSRFQVSNLGLLLLVSVLTTSGSAWAQAAQTAPARVPANELVAKVVENELNAKDGGNYMYRDRRETPNATVTKEMIETKEGTIARTIALNDKPLSSEQRAQDDQKLQRLVNDPSAMKDKRKEQKEDEERVKKMFRELPRAFIYEYDGTEMGKDGRELIRLTFTPKSDYDPPSRETSVYRAMSGKMWVDQRMERLARIEATLFRDVNFGWGILGHLDKGGHFFIEQTHIGNDRWEPTYMNIQFTGKALLFKTINLRQIETLSAFQPVPADLTLAQAVEMLKKTPEQVAENKGSK